MSRPSAGAPGGRLFHLSAKDRGASNRYAAGTLKKSGRSRIVPVVLASEHFMTATCYRRTGQRTSEMTCAYL